MPLRLRTFILRQNKYIMQTKYHSSTRSSLAVQYKVSLPTFKKWLKLTPNLVLSDNQRTLTPKQVETIVNHLGEPPD